MNLPDQIKYESIQKIVDIASKMLKDEINLVKGSREIYRLMSNIDNPDNNIFNIFTLIVSDTDHIPVDESVRRHFESDYLKEADEKLNKYLEHMKPEILEGCRKIIDKYSKKTNNI